VVCPIVVSMAFGRQLVLRHLQKPQHPPLGAQLFIHLLKVPHEPLALGLEFLHLVKHTPPELSD
jgi:hypothetical protein